MDTLLLKEALLKELKYAESPDLKYADLWHNDRPIPSVENAYFVQGVPVVYFSRIEDSAHSADDIWRLYRSVWSQSKVPLLYVITPQEIRIYNGYAEPTKDSAEFAKDDNEQHSNRLLKHLRQLTDVETARQEIQQQLHGYDRLYLETGAFWQTDDGQKIKRESRADQRLLNAMKYVRDLLLEKLPKDEYAAEIAYILLGRSLFICYLESRGILTPEWMLEITGGRADKYLSVLEDKEMTYHLFSYLNQRFNGDLFRVDPKERERIRNPHLHDVRQFLAGDDLRTGQLALLPYYDFTHIPIELISGIYGTFFSDGTQEDLGAYYTPLALVDFLIEEALPRDKVQLNTTILDPTCGSGVFLVRTYQRLVEAWKRENKQEKPHVRLYIILSKILEEQIFGVDIQRSAIRIAAFSLYLAMLDFLERDDILDEHFRFPNLEGSNLICEDFLSSNVEDIFASKKFDRVIGNLPWGKGRLQGEALKRAKTLGYSIGGKQLVQPLLEHAPKFCSENGELALLASAKATLFVTSDTHEAFREKFLQRYHIRAVVNFSLLRYELFPDAVSPMVALFYSPSLPNSPKKLVYAAPKPSSLSQRLGAIVLDANEIKFLERKELLQFPDLWKVALWGNPRDAAIIQHLQTFPTLMQQAIKYDWLLELRKGKKDIPQGYIVGKKGKAKEALWLQGMSCVDTNRFKPYLVEAHGVVEESHFVRSRSQQIYQGPLVLIRRSKCEAAFFSGGQIAYRDKITGVPGRYGQEYLLKWLVAYINSPLAFYYHFLTSTSWSVERGTIIHEEYKRMPFVIPDENDPRLKEIINSVDQIIAITQQNNSREIANLREHINDLVYEIYELSSLEIQVVKDMVEHIVPLFQWSVGRQRMYVGDKATPVQSPDIYMLKAYAKTFIDTATNLLRYRDQTLNAYIYQDGAPLIVLEFELVSQGTAKDVQYMSESDDLRQQLSLLDRLLLEKQNATFYTRRQVRLFDGPRFYIVRPGERHLWTCSQALADADGFLAEILVHSRKLTLEASR